jgi:3-hydroxyisobutyrate dehydrogenase-like beta-hydroxyacid dehydrogenase
MPRPYVFGVMDASQSNQSTGIGNFRRKIRQPTAGVSRALTSDIDCEYFNHERMDMGQAKMNQKLQQAGFIGLGVMGEPMCRNLAVKSGLRVLGYDLNPKPLERLAKHGITGCGAVRGAVTGSDVVFLCLPSGEAVFELAYAADGLLANMGAGQLVVDLSTSSVEVTRELHNDFAARGVTFIDAPVARTRAAAEAGTLSVMVGSDVATFERIRPLIETFAEEITLCGPVGSGQVLKILNNVILFHNVLILAEAKQIGEHAGVDSTVLFETLAKGSADSFALRNHGIKAILKEEYPLNAFSVRYARKDLNYARQLAQSAGVDAESSLKIDALFARAIEAGDGDHYWPVISRLLNG